MYSGKVALLSGLTNAVHWLEGLGMEHLTVETLFSGGLDHFGKQSLDNRQGACFKSARAACSEAKGQTSSSSFFLLLKFYLFLLERKLYREEEAETETIPWSTPQIATTSRVGLV